MKIIFRDAEIFELASYWAASQMPSWVGKKVQQKIEVRDGSVSLTLELVEVKEEAAQK
ncbi:hypothetical protein ACOTI8_30555 [Achromobacter xylosoxidans]